MIFTIRTGTLPDGSTNVEPPGDPENTDWLSVFGSMTDGVTCCLPAVQKEKVLPVPGKIPAKAGETSRQAIARELFEETGILAAEDEFELLDTDIDKNNIYDFYALKRPVSLKDIVLLPGETDGVQWASYGKIHWMIRTGRICKIIGHQFYRQEKMLKLRNTHKYGR